MKELGQVIPFVPRETGDVVERDWPCPVIPIDALSDESPEVIINDQGNYAYDLSSLSASTEVTHPSQLH